jgi:hypothetical protein
MLPGCSANLSGHLPGCCAKLHRLYCLGAVPIFATLWSCTKCVVTFDVIWAVYAIAALSKKRAFPCSYPGHLLRCSANFLGRVQCQPIRPSAWAQCQLTRPDRLCVVPLHIIVRRTMVLNKWSGQAKKFNNKERVFYRCVALGLCLFVLLMWGCL